MLRQVAFCVTLLFNPIANTVTADFFIWKYGIAKEIMDVVQGLYELVKFLKGKKPKDVNQKRVKQQYQPTVNAYITNGYRIMRIIRHIPRNE
jgi:hypothetical protein